MNNNGTLHKLLLFKYSLSGDKVIKAARIWASFGDPIATNALSIAIKFVCILASITTWISEPVKYTAAITNFFFFWYCICVIYWLFRFFSRVFLIILPGYLFCAWSGSRRCVRSYTLEARLMCTCEPCRIWHPIEYTLPFYRFTLVSMSHEVANRAK